MFTHQIGSAYAARCVRALAAPTSSKSQCHRAPQDQSMTRWRDAMVKRVAAAVLPRRRANLFRRNPRYPRSLDASNGTN